MKNILLSSLVGFILCFTGCEVTTDYIFDEISSHRIAKYIDTCQAVLKKAPHGWKFVYYPDESQYGSYTFLLDFIDDQRVQMQWDATSETSNSSYGFDASHGPVLSFNAYSLLHRLADPNPAIMGGKPAVGYGGEFEFMIRDVQDDKISLLTKNTKSEAVMVWATEEDWDNMDKNQQMLTKFELDRNKPLYHYLQVGDDIALFLYSVASRMFYVIYPQGGEMVSEAIAMESTPEGIRLAKPLTIGGATISTVTINNGEMSLVNSDANVRFFRASSAEENCLVRAPGSVSNSQKYDGYNMIVHGRGFDKLIVPERYMEDFRFYWNLVGNVGLEVYLRPETGIATYAAKYVSYPVEDGVGDQVKFESTIWTYNTGAVTNGDATWFGGISPTSGYETLILRPMFASEEGMTVLCFGKHTFLIKNGDNMSWGLFSAKEGRE